MKIKECHKKIFTSIFILYCYYQKTVKTYSQKVYCALLKNNVKFILVSDLVYKHIKLSQIFKTF